MTLFKKKGNESSLHYQSPFKILEWAGLQKDGELTVEDLKLAGKILLTEFELKRQTTILVSGLELSRNDVIKMFDAFNAPNIIKYHQAIQEDIFLQTFLEQHVVDLDYKIKDNPIYQEEDFKVFVAPYFAEAFKINYIQLLSSLDHVTAKVFFELPKLWDAYNEEKAWSGVRPVLELKLEELKKAKSNLFWYGIKPDGRGERRFFSQILISFLNKLPDSFMEFRNNYLYALLEIALVCYRNSKWRTGGLIIDCANSLNRNYRIKSNLPELEDEINNLVRYVRSGRNFTEDEKSARSTIYLIVTLAIALLRIAACSHH